MKTQPLWKWPMVLAAGALAAVGVLLATPQVAGRGERGELAEAVEVQTRGPVHEAFATVVTAASSPGIVVTVAPPEPLAEEPPDLRPEGDNVGWIPGYWSWDDDRDDFIWVSGVWRVAPPGREWVPGYWSQTTDGHQWVPGFWNVAVSGEVEYLPPPPEPIEVAPPPPPPSPDYIWEEGCWIWSGYRYVWRPGYWVQVNPNWMWIPAYYVPTPCGHVFVEGYWDHRIRSRGVVFAPVCFTRPVYTRPAYVFSPTIVINVTIMTESLFIRPSYHHYYFGDFYGEQYGDMGIYPWFSTRTRVSVYDPIYADFRWRRMHEDSEWENRLMRQYRYRQEHVDARPLRTFADEQALVRRGAPGAQQLVIGQALAQVARSKTAPVRFQTINAQRRQELFKNAQEVQKYGDERGKLERKSAATRAEGPAKAPAPFKLPLPPPPAPPAPPKAPVKIAKATPPPLPAAPTIPKLDPSIKPKIEGPLGAPKATPTPMVIGPKPGAKRVTPTPKAVGPKVGGAKITPTPKAVGRKITPTPTPEGPPPVGRKKATPTPKKVGPKVTPTPTPEGPPPVGRKKATPTPKGEAPTPRATIKATPTPKGVGPNVTPTPKAVGRKITPTPTPEGPPSGGRKKVTPTPKSELPKTTPRLTPTPRPELPKVTPRTELPKGEPKPPSVGPGSTQPKGKEKPPEGEPGDEESKPGKSKGKGK